MDVAPYKVILDACVVEHGDLLLLATNRQLNMVPCERPSDCARSAVRAYELDAERFRAQTIASK